MSLGDPADAELLCDKAGHHKTDTLLPTPLQSIVAALKPYIFSYRLTNFPVILTFLTRGGNIWEILQTTSASPSKFYKFPIFPVTSPVSESL